jgi:predicted glycosyltransferase
MYSQDGNGLGHLRRSVNIATELRRRNPRCDILIVADSPAASIVGSAPGIDVVKLPTILKTGTTTWTSAKLNMPTRRLLHMRAQLMLLAFTEFAPDAVLVDHMPVGALGELKPVLDNAMARRRPPRLFLGLRDVLDLPVRIRHAWRQTGAYEYLPAYDAVLIYGTRSVFDASAAYGLADAQEIEYCNYVARPRRALPATDGPAAPFVLMMGGGGGDAYPLATAFADSTRAVQGLTGVGAVILPGPNMSPAEVADLVRRAPDSVQVVTGCPDSARWIPGAAAIVTMAGYNSLCEVLAWEKKAVVVPRPGPSAEQRMRSTLFSRRSLIRAIQPERLTSERLGAGLHRLLAEEDVPNLDNIPPLDGAERAADTLLDRVQARSRPRRAAAPAGAAADHAFVVAGATGALS